MNRGLVLTPEISMLHLRLISCIICVLLKVIDWTIKQLLIRKYNEHEERQQRPV